MLDCCPETFVADQRASTLGSFTAWSGRAAELTEGSELRRRVAQSYGNRGGNIVQTGLPTFSRSAGLLRYTKHLEIHSIFFS